VSKKKTIHIKNQKEKEQDCYVLAFVDSLELEIGVLNDEFICRPTHSR
jgi:hypothetical protein